MCEFMKTYISPIMNPKLLGWKSELLPPNPCRKVDESTLFTWYFKVSAVCTGAELRHPSRVIRQLHRGSQSSLFPFYLIVKQTYELSLVVYEILKYVLETTKKWKNALCGGIKIHNYPHELYIQCSFNSTREI